MKIGILGAGQLGRMLALAGLPLGHEFRFLDPNPDSPAKHVGEFIVADYDDPDALKKFASGLDVATFEFENVPEVAATYLSNKLTTYPLPRALKVSQDRLTEKSFFQEIGGTTSRFEQIDSRESLHKALHRIELPAVLKTRRLGYDGKGQCILLNKHDVDTAWGKLGAYPLILEGFVAFERELSIILVRGLDKNIAVYPLTENIHRESILRLSTTPAPAVTQNIQSQAETIARSAMEELDYVGVLTIELFQVDGRVIVNEMAPRVHNSGHWTINGTECSQFENHIRAITGAPLGDTSARGCSAMINIVGTDVDSAKILSLPDVHLHLYGKASKPGRKLGHINVLTHTLTDLDNRLEQLRALQEPGLF